MAVLNASQDSILHGDKPEKSNNYDIAKSTEEQRLDGDKDLDGAATAVTASSGV